MLAPEIWRDSAEAEKTSFTPENDSTAYLFVSELKALVTEAIKECQAPETARPSIKAHLCPGSSSGLSAPADPPDVSSL